MKEGQKLWTREELILAINLYCKLPFGLLHTRNPVIIKLANLIGRTPSSVSLKLVNFASLDPSLKQRGMANASKLDREVWNEFYEHWDVLPYESEKLLAKFEHTTVEKLNRISDTELREGKTRDQMVKVRVNQSFFRTAVLAAYNNTCCITGISQPELLVAGHIKPWSKDEKNRVNPRNGIAINGLHDRAFETGLLTIMPDFKIKISNLLLKGNQASIVSHYFAQYNNQSIKLPSRFLPDVEFLKWHNDERFKG